MLGVGDTVEHYRIESVLGEGGMGRVYRALDTRLERHVALKLLLPGDGGADAAARLIREARAAAALDHPNAVHVYGVGSIDGAPYIAMELVRGQTLRERLATSPSASIAVRIGWLACVGRALAAAHALGIVHRDIKPDNVMIKSDGQVKVLDFGIARRLAAAIDPSAPTDASAPTVTASGVAIGTPAYMAPEQIRGLTVDARADQFAWGITAYEVLAGARPWSGDALSLVAAIVSDEAPPLSSRVPDLPAGVSEIVGRALEKRPEDRFASMDELCAALEPLTKHGTSITPTSKPTTPRTIGGELAIAALDIATNAATAIVESRKRADAKASWPKRLAIPVAGLGLAALLLSSGRDRRAIPVDPAAAPPSAASPAVVASTSSHPIGPTLPASTPPAAARAFAEAISLWRTRSETLAVAQLEHAIELDPTLAAAQLRYALFSFGEAPTEARNHLLKVQDVRRALDPPETALLDAALAYMAEPPDVAGFATRLGKMVERDPNDLEALYWLAFAKRTVGDSDEARTTLERALAVDPSFAPASSMKSDIQLSDEGDFEGALATTNACVAKNPGSALCISNQIIIPALLGRCDEAEQKARAWAATMPEHPAGFYNLASILDGKGRPAESVEELLKTVADRMRPSQRDYAMAWDHAKLAIAHGQFDEAERRLADAERLAPARGETGLRSGLVNTLARVYLEEGKSREAGEIADALLKRESALTPTNLASWRGIAFDPMLLVASVAAHYGSLSKNELDKRRAAWLTEQEKAIGPRLDQNLKLALWAHAWVATAETPDEAKAALAKFDSDLPPVVDTFPETLVDIGHVHLLAGDAAGAIPILRRALKNCEPLDHPLVLVRAHAMLGEALEATGDKAGARAEYDALIARWGMAKPKSVTAEKVKARRKALGN